MSNIIKYNSDRGVFQYHTDHDIMLTKPPNFDNILINNQTQIEQQYKNNRDFKIFFEEYDHRRNTNFVKTFPEMAEWYRNII
jgi:hypothetical protein